MDQELSLYHGGVAFIGSTHLSQTEQILDGNRTVAPCLHCTYGVRRLVTGLVSTTILSKLRSVYTGD